MTTAKVPPLKPPDFAAWRLRENVELWEAALLLHGIDPTGLERFAAPRQRDGGAAWPGRLNLPLREVQRERALLAQLAALPGRPYHVTLDTLARRLDTWGDGKSGLYMVALSRDPTRVVVRLSDVVRFAAAAGWRVPDALVPQAPAAAGEPLQADAGEREAAPVPGVGVPAAQSWEEQALGIAREILARDRAKQLYPSNVELSRIVAQRMREMGITGAYGAPLESETIRRQVLLGMSRTDT